MPSYEETSGEMESNPSWEPTPEMSEAPPLSSGEEAPPSYNYDLPPESSEEAPPSYHDQGTPESSGEPFEGQY